MNDEFNAIIPNPMKFAKENIKLAITYYGLPFESTNNFRLDDNYIYDKDYIVQDNAGNAIIVITRNSSFIAGKYILTMLNKLTNELVTKEEVIVPIKSLVNFFELDLYLPIGFDNFLYNLKNKDKIYDTYFIPKKINTTAFLINLPLYYYGYAAYLHNEFVMLSLLYPLLEYGYTRFEDLRIITPIDFDKIEKTDGFLKENYKQARNKLLVQFANYML